MSIKPLIAAIIAAIMTGSPTLAIGSTVSPFAPITVNNIAKSGDEYSNRITLAELVECDCAHSNGDSWSKGMGAGAVAPHAGIRFYLLRKKNSG